ncbi:MAG: VWA domain-containing protein [Hyphomicrobiales bacterium]
MMLPQPVVPFVQFSSLLRAHGFAIAPEQTSSFIEAIGLLGPKDMNDIRRGALAMLAIPREREVEFDALFRAFFMGQTVGASATTDDEEDEVEAFEPDEGEAEVPESEEVNEAGAEAVATENLSQRGFVEVSEDATLADFVRRAPARLPRRKSYRRAPARRGDALNMRKTLRDAVRRDGEVFTLAQLKRKTRQRRILLLIDVSGSMKDQTDSTIRFAHTLAQISDRFEAFTFGTRLTRITPALKLKNRDEALARTSRLVADFDGGTRIGDALQAFLSVPRFAGFVRGAAVVVLSDGLERGSPNEMIDAVWRLSRLAWRTDWLTPLAHTADYEPKTEALAAVKPYLDSLSDGSSTQSICNHILNISRAA